MGVEGLELVGHLTHEQSRGLLVEALLRALAQGHRGPGKQTRSVPPSCVLPLCFWPWVLGPVEEGRHPSGCSNCSWGGYVLCDRIGSIPFLVVVGVHLAGEARGP